MKTMLVLSRGTERIAQKDDEVTKLLSWNFVGIVTCNCVRISFYLNSFECQFMIIFVPLSFPLLSTLGYACTPCDFIRDSRDPFCPHVG